MLSPERTSASHLFLPRFRGLRRDGGKRVPARGSGQPQQNSRFQTRLGSSACELTVVATACVRNEQEQAKCGPSVGAGCHKDPSAVEEMMITYRCQERRSSFSKDVAPGTLISSEWPHTQDCIGSTN